MTLQRYLFTLDLTYPQDRTLRYEAAGEEDLAAAFRRLHPLDAASQPYEVARLTGLNLLDKKFWAVVDADLIHSLAESMAHPDLWPPVEGSIPAQMQAFLAESHTSVDRFINYCDIPLAQAWLRVAREEIVSARTARPRYEPGETPNAYVEEAFRDGGVQRAVMSANNAFAQYLSALNLHPWSVAKLRLALERALVLDSGVTINFGGVTATRPKPPPILSIRSLGTEPFCAAPLTAEETSIGPWRAYYVRWLNARGIPASTSRRIVFTVPSVVRRPPTDLSKETDCLRLHADGEPGWEPTAGSESCESGPRDNTLSLWIGNNGFSYCPGFGTSTNGFEAACGPNLFCPSFFGAFDADGDDVDPNDLVARADAAGWYVASLLGWHLDMIDELVTYAEGLSPFEFIVATRLDATGKNQWTADRFGPQVLTGSNPASFVAQQAVSRGEQEQGDVDRLIAISGTAVSAVLSATPLGPLGGAIGGAVTSVATFFNHVIDHTPHNPSYQADVFGRVEPAMEVFQRAPLGSPSSADRDMARLAMPAPPPGYTPEEASVRYGWDPPVRVTPVVPGIVAVPPIYRPMVTAENARTVANVAQSASTGSRVAAVAGATLLAGAIGFSVSAARARKRRLAQGQLELAPAARGPTPSPGLPAPRRPRARTAGASR